MSASRTKKSSPLRRILWIAGAAFLLLAAAAVWSVFETRSLTVRHFNAALKNWHPEHHNMKIAVLSDFHISDTSYSFDRMKRCVELTNAEKPDLVLLLGDFIGTPPENKKHLVFHQKMAGIFGALQSRYGVYAVHGNHDIRFYPDVMRREFFRHGITTLENNYITLKIRGQKLQLFGLPDYGTRGFSLYKNVFPDPNIPTIVLSHNPIYFQGLQLPYELMISGHTHGGQLNIFGFTPASFFMGFRFYRKGWDEHFGRKLFITTGIGVSGIPFRLGAPPEIVILTFSAPARRILPNLNTPKKLY